MQTRLQRLLALSVIAVAAQAGVHGSALAQVNFNIQIGPPAQVYEQVPVMAPGYVWAPGYWAWHGDRHIWVRGRTMVQRVGYRWEPDVWEQRNNVYYRHPGRWERDGDGPGKSGKHGKKEKHRKYDKRDGR